MTRTSYGASIEFDDDDPPADLPWSLAAVIADVLDHELEGDWEVSVAGETITSDDP